MNSRRTRLRSALAAILTVLVLVPAGVLFARVWGDASERRESTQREQQGVEYLGALAGLVSSLVEYQSSALQGVKEPPGSLSAAVGRIDEINGRLGDTLRTNERWAGLKDNIGKLPQATGSPLQIFQAHGEATDLTLALYAAVRRNSELNRDPDSDMSNLQQATAVDMPRIVVRVSQMGDLANLLQNTTGAARNLVNTQFGQAVLDVQSAVNSLTENLQAAVDNTSSATLSGSLVSTLDAFRRGVEAMIRGANPGGNPNVATMSTAQTTLQTALGSLSTVTLREMERLLDERMDELNYRRGEAIVMAVVALALVIGAVLWPLLGRRRESSQPETPARPVGESTRDIAPAQPVGTSPFGTTPYEPAPGFGDLDPTRRERSGALR